MGSKLKKMQKYNSATFDQLARYDIKGYNFVKNGDIV